MTYDLGGDTGTREFADAVIERMAATPAGVAPAAT